MAEEVEQITRERDDFMKTLARIAKEGCLEDHFIDDSTASPPADPRRVSCLDILGQVIRRNGTMYTVETPCVACRAGAVLKKHGKENVAVVLGG